MTELDKLMLQILKLFPNATIGDDSDGQLIIYTDMRETLDGQLVPFETEAIDNV